MEITIFQPNFLIIFPADSSCVVFILRKYKFLSSLRDFLVAVKHCSDFKFPENRRQHSVKNAASLVQNLLAGYLILLWL